MIVGSRVKGWAEKKKILIAFHETMLILFEYFVSNNNLSLPLKLKSLFF